MSAKMRTKRGVSPVIATVILVAVAITVAVAVAYWMSGIAGQYTSFEKVEIQGHYSKFTPGVDPLPGQWEEFIDLKNSGSADATITNVFINNIPLDDYTTSVTMTYDGTTVPDLADISIPVAKGSEVGLVITIPEGTEGCTHGTTIDVKIVTAAGNQYPILEKLQ